MCELHIFLGVPAGHTRHPQDQLRNVSFGSDTCNKHITLFGLNCSYNNDATFEFMCGIKSAVCYGMYVQVTAARMSIANRTNIPNLCSLTASMPLTGNTGIPITVQPI